METREEFLSPVVQKAMNLALLIIAIIDPFWIYLAQTGLLLRKVP